MYRHPPSHPGPLRYLATPHGPLGPETLAALDLSTIEKDGEPEYAVVPDDLIEGSGTAPASRRSRWPRAAGRAGCCSWSDVTRRAPDDAAGDR